MQMYQKIEYKEQYQAKDLPKGITAYLQTGIYADKKANGKVFKAAPTIDEVLQDIQYSTGFRFVDKARKEFALAPAKAVGLEVAYYNDLKRDYQPFKESNKKGAMVLVSRAKGSEVTVGDTPLDWRSISES